MFTFQFLIYFYLLGSVNALSRSISELFIASRGLSDTIFATINKMMPEFIGKHPKLAKFGTLLGKAFNGIFWIGAIYAICITFVVCVQYKKTAKINNFIF